jgi:hypothetical protein
MMRGDKVEMSMKSQKPAQAVRTATVLALLRRSETMMRRLSHKRQRRQRAQAAHSRMTWGTSFHSKRRLWM